MSAYLYAKNIGNIKTLMVLDENVVTLLHSIKFESNSIFIMKITIIYFMTECPFLIFVP